jgi:hypothetical protein
MPRQPLASTPQENAAMADADRRVGKAETGALADGAGRRCLAHPTAVPTPQSGDQPRTKILPKIGPSRLLKSQRKSNRLALYQFQLFLEYG